MENTLRKFIRRILTEKRFEDISHGRKDTWFTLHPDDFEQLPGERGLNDEIYDLIQNAYANLGGNLKYRSPDHLPGDLTFMLATDLDADPDPDVFRGGKQKGGKLKLSVVGRKEGDAAKNAYTDKTAELLRSGAIAELGDAIAHIMMKYKHIPAATDQRTVEDLIGKKIEWIGPHPDPAYARTLKQIADQHGLNYEGWYYRNIKGKKKLKILLGTGVL